MNFGSQRILTVLGMVLLSANMPALAASSGSLPGSADAIEDAIGQAAHEAAGEIINLVLPEDVKTIAIFPLFGDTDGAATAVLEEAMTEACGEHGLRLVTLADPAWRELSGGWEITTESIDMMPVLPAFAESYPAGAMAWGRLRYAEIDDSRFNAKARIEMTVGLADSGVIGTSIGNGLVTIDAETYVSGTIMNIAGKPWFWIAVVVGVVGIVVIIVLALPLMRRVGMATKPRRVVR